MYTLIRDGVGSSPLTRGKLVNADRVRSLIRLIPAHAGKTLTLPSETILRKAHPRSRGENLNPNREQAVEAGSSPLTRGKPSAAILYGSLSRLIPAHAGKTIPRWRCRRGVTAHPRSRGENADSDVSVEPLNGSSPLTRGKRVEGGG